MFSANCGETIMRAPTLLRIVQVLATTAGLAMVMGAYASDGHGHDAHEPAAKAEKPAKADKAEKAEKAGKPEAKAEANPELKGEGKAEIRREPPAPLPSGGAVSMSELRDMIDQKIAEVRAKREPAPVVRLRPRPPAAKPAPAPTRVAMADAHGGGGANAHGAPGGDHGGPSPMGHDVHWAYAGDTGPDSWGRLKPEFQQCMLGKRQSPIDIREGIPVQLDPIQFDYRPSGFRVIDNGHTVQVNVEPGNSITVGGRRYDLIQFHFHRPSEERINGRQFEMVAHLVHKDLDGRLAVVAVLMDQGKAHPLVQMVWNNLPLEKNQEQVAMTNLDMTLLLPELRQYYTYMGSLTTPPCTEGVLWMVMKQPASMSREQVAVFSKLYAMNARPIQSPSGRLIKDGQ
jgi:carbonic anhydrase